MTASIKPRIEKDRFGELTIPEGALFGIQTARAVSNLSFSSKKLSEYDALVRNLALVKKAAARVNRITGQIDDKLASAIEAACEEIIDGKHNDQFPVDMLHGGGGIAFNMNANEVIANLANLRVANSPPGTYAPIDPKEHVNASQSTADVCHTAFRLAIHDRFQPLNNNLLVLAGQLEDSSSRFAGITTLARTCLQDAMPVAIGELFGGYAELIGRRGKEAERAVEQLNSINLGGTVIGTGDGAAPAYREKIVEALAELAGRKLRHRTNLFDAAQNSDDLACVSSQVEHLAQALIKITKDLRLLSSGPEAGFGELILPRVQEGSSFFHKKNNPVIPETVLSCCFQVIGLNRAAQAAVENAELYLNVFEGVAVTNILDSIAMLTAAINLLSERCLDGLEVDRERCKKHAASRASFNHAAI